MLQASTALAQEAHFSEAPTPLFTPAASAEGTELGAPGAARRQLYDVAPEDLARVAESPATASLELVRLPERLDRLRSLRFGYAPGRGLAHEAGAEGVAWIVAQRDRVEVTTSERYAWVGTLYDERTDEMVGEVTFVVAPRTGQVIGTVQIGSDVFQVQPLGLSQVHALVDLDERALSDEEGTPVVSEGEDVGAHSEPLPAAPPASFGASAQSQAGITCPPQKTRVLVVYNALARQAVSNMDATIALAIQETNDAYAASAMDNVRLELAHSQEIVFAESNNIENDLNRLLIDPLIISLRNQHSADVVKYISRGYTHDPPSISRLKPDSTEAYGITRHDLATGIFIFGQEVGHIQGAEHHPDDQASFSSDTYPFARGHRFSDSDCHWLFGCRTNYYATMMAYTTSPFQSTTTYTRVKRFSNPVITYDSQPTGIPNERDNAHAIRLHAPTVADFRDPGELVVGISAAGPAPPSPGFYTFSAAQCDGPSPTTYAWYNSTTLGVYGPPVSTASTYAPYLDAPAANGPVTTYYVKLVATSGGNQSTAYFTQDVIAPCDPTQPGCLGTGGGLLRAGAPAEALPGSPSSAAATTPGVYPNPAATAATVVLRLDRPTMVDLRVYDALGREVYRVREQAAVGTHSAALDVSALPPGSYLVVAEAEGRRTTSPLVVAR
jgi:hypothetical protein